MRDFVRKPVNWFLIMIVVAVMAALFINFFSSTSSNLPSYEGADPNIEPSTEAEEASESIETVIYTNSDYGFSMPVPADWTSVVKSGMDSFVNDDGAMISFSVSGYDPTLNLVTADSIKADIAAAGGLSGGYSQLSTSSYFAIYEIGSIDYFELTSWSLDTTVRVSITVPITKYTEYADMASYLLEDFTWEKTNPIPEDSYIYYSSYGNFEFLLPSAWTTGIEDGCLIAADPDTGATLRVTVTNSTGGFDSISQLDYYTIMSSGKDNYLQSSYSNNGALISGTASFTYEGVNYMEVHNLLATGSYQYEFLFQCPTEYYDAAYSGYSNAVSYFRYW